MLNRRNWMVGAAALPAAAQAQTAGKPKNIVISSANGLTCCDIAMSWIRSGKDTLDAVVAGVNVNELDPNDNSVGYGGLPNEEGVVELDACVMHGPTRRAGSVASIRGIKTPSKIAKLVMEETDHVMLAGEGALRFAKSMGFTEENLLRVTAFCLQDEDVLPAADRILTDRNSPLFTRQKFFPHGADLFDQ